MRFIKIPNRRGSNYDHGTKYTVTDLERSNNQYTFEAGCDRIPRNDSKVWSHRYTVWDVEGNCKIRDPRP